MPMSNQTPLNDVRLDRAIDRAVRELMQVDPAPGMRRRVLSRINAPVEWRALPAMRYALAAVALVVVVMSISLIPGHVEPPTPPKAPPLAVATTVPPVDPEALQASTRTETAVIPGTSRGLTKQPIPMPPVTNVFGGRPGGISAATVDGPGHIRVAPETLAPLTIVPLSARPLVIEPLLLQRVPKQIP